MFVFLFLFSVIETLDLSRILNFCSGHWSTCRRGFWLLKESYLQIGDRSPGSAWDVEGMNLRKRRRWESLVREKKSSSERFDGPSLPLARLWSPLGRMQWQCWAVVDSSLGLFLGRRCWRNSFFWEWGLKAWMHGWAYFLCCTDIQQGGSERTWVLGCSSFCT